MKPVDAPLSTSAPLRALLATLHLASPALPVGGFAYSQGLEKAVDDALVHDFATASRWIADMLLLSLARLEAPLWLRAFDACHGDDSRRFAHWNSELLCLRETAELRAESQQMGSSMLRLLGGLGFATPKLEPLSYPAAFALACHNFGIDRAAGLTAYLWSWLENQALVAVKSVPLGQQDGQRLLFALHQLVVVAVVKAARLQDDELGSATIGLALTCARHELQYSRLYRS